MVASLGGYAFHSSATGLGGVVQGTAQSSAGDVARGSFNAGQVNYRNVSAGTTSLGSFSLGRTDFFTTSGLQETVGNITKQGGRIEGRGLSVDNAFRLAAIRGDAFSRNVVAAMSAIAGQNASANMVINPQGRLESAEMVSGDGGFGVRYDGRGRLVVMKGGVEHGSVELDNSGRIKGFESGVQVGGMNVDYITTRAKEISEAANAYRQVGEAFKTIASKGKEAVDFQSLRKNLSKLAESNFADFMEAVKAWGEEERMADAIVRAVGRRYQHDFEKGNATRFGAGVGGGAELSLGATPKRQGEDEKRGFRLGLLKFGAGGYVDLNTGRYYSDADIRRMSALLSRDERDELVKAFVESLQNKTGERSSDSQAKRDELTHTKGTDVSERVSNSKVYDVAESFGRKAEDKLAYAKRMQASLKQDPLNYYAQQKYKEALAAGKSEGEAVRYAIEEVAKLRSNPSALEQWLNEFAEGKGIRSPSVNEKGLEGVQIPKEEEIRAKGQELESGVKKDIAGRRNEISQGLDEINLFNPRKAKLFELKKPKLNLGFSLNDPQLKSYEEGAQRWYNSQPGVYRRAFNDLTKTVEDLKRWSAEFVKRLEDIRPNILNTPPNKPPEKPIINEKFDLKR